MATLDVLYITKPKMKLAPLIGCSFFFAASALSAGDEVDHRDVPGLVYEISTMDSKLVESPVTPGTKIHWHSLVSFKVLRRETSALIQLAGKVVSNNAGIPSEGLPIFFGSDLHRPRLADTTDVAGQFRFTVWLNEDRPSASLRASALEKGKIYLDGLPDSNGSLVKGLTRAYSLEELMAHQLPQNSRTAQ